MAHVTKHKMFVDTGDSLQEARNFQGYLFNDLDLRKNDKPISFYRSDFRSTKFSSFFLAHNNFDRADFIDSYLEKGEIDACIFGTDFLNTYFYEVVFSRNSFHSCSFNNCTFDSCRFEGDSFKEVGMRHCVFKNCKLDQVHFAMNTLDEIEFVDSGFFNIDFSNQTAINISFVNCTFDALTIDPDYIGSYFTRGDFLGKVNFIYRGHEVQLFKEQHEIIKGFISIYQNTTRYYELMNLYFLLSIQESLTSKDMLAIIIRLFKEENLLVRDYHLVKIMDLVKFYMTDPKTSLVIYSFIIKVIERCITQEKDDEGLLLMWSRLNFLKLSLENQILERGFDDQSFRNRVITIRIELAANDLDQARILVEDFFNEQLSSLSLDSKSEQSYFEITDVKFGSVVIDVVCYAFLMIPLSYIFKNVLGNKNVAQVDYAEKEMIVKLSKKVKTTKDAKEVQKLAQSYRKSVTTLGPKAKNLSEVMKSLKVFINA